MSKLAEKLEKAPVLPPDPMPGVTLPEAVEIPVYEKRVVAIRPKKRSVDLGGVITAVTGIALSVAGLLVEQTPDIIAFLRDLGTPAETVGEIAKWLGYLTVIYAAVSRAKGAAKTAVPMLLLMLLPVAAVAQQAPQAPFPKLRELETITLTSAGSWRVATEAPLLVSGTDSARVYLGTDPASRVIIARIGVERWIYAGRFGWYRVSALNLAEYNQVQNATPLDYAYLNFHPFEYALAVAVSRDGPAVLPEGASMPRALR